MRTATAVGTLEREPELIAAEKALASRPPAVSVAPVVTPADIALIKDTIAVGATDAELKLFLFDCARQGVHPLDRLIHFSVRTDKYGKRKYTPITSIDFMRIRAAETGEMAGSDDPVFDGHPNGDDSPPLAATVTVYRLTQGQRFPYTATARWSEYKPAEDFMWRKMPHTMLAKCAEALALRKGFPRQLAGLYAKEEMDQANGADIPQGHATGHAVRAQIQQPSVTEHVATPAGAPFLPAPTPQAPAAPAALEEREVQAAATGENRGTSLIPDDDANVYAPDDWRDSMKAIPSDAFLLTKVTTGTGDIAGFLFHHQMAVGEGEGLPIWKADQYASARRLCPAGVPVTLELATSKKSGKPYVKTVRAYAPF